jgi:hypothetical protein
VLRIDGYYLYQTGSQIHPLSELRAYAMPGSPQTTVGEARSVVYVAEAAVEGLVSRSIFRLRTSVQSGKVLLTAIRALRAKLEGGNLEDPLQWTDVIPVTTALTTFEAVLGAELALMPIYVVTPKAGYDTAILIEGGTACFPEDIWTKAPDAIADLSYGTRCVALSFSLRPASISTGRMRRCFVAIGMLWPAALPVHKVGTWEIISMR